jgi:predicted kinase
MIKNIKTFVIILVGPPLSGKSTWIKNNYPDLKVISRDNILLEMYGENDYNKAWKEVDQKAVDKALLLKFQEANSSNESVIVDMTHMASKRRISNLQYFSDNYYKICVVFPILTDDEYSERNKIRTVNENKTISMGIVKSMINSYQVPTKEEGFNEIIFL